MAPPTVSMRLRSAVVRRAVLRCAAALTVPVLPPGALLRCRVLAMGLDCLRQLASCKALLQPAHRATLQALLAAFWSTTAKSRPPAGALPWRGRRLS